MRATRLVISDLHLADGSFPLDCFGSRQQEALSTLLRTFSRPSSAVSTVEDSEVVELIINGDCFDFLATTPYSFQRVSDRATALQKIEKIIAAHTSFFAELRAFIALPGRSITFVAGNHDPELCFVPVQERLCRALTEQDRDGRIAFCTARIYRPCPDVYIEHGHHYDFWNQTVQGLWDEEGRPLSADPQELLLPFGSVYYQLVLSQISQRYPFFDHWEPHMGHIRQIGLLCLLDPELVVELAARTMRMLSYPRQALARLAAGEEQDPVQLFDLALQDFLAFRADIEAQMRASSSDAPPAVQSPVSQEDMQEFMTVRAALSQPLREAVAALCSPIPVPGDDPVTAGMHSVLLGDSALRYALAGHTHSPREDMLNGNTQIYFNSGSWADRYAQPAPAEVTPELVAWLRAPDWRQIPLRDLTRLTFVELITEDGRPTRARLREVERK